METVLPAAHRVEPVDGSRIAAKVLAASACMPDSTSWWLFGFQRGAPGDRVTEN